VIVIIAGTVPPSLPDPALLPDPESTPAAPPGPDPLQAPRTHTANHIVFFMHRNLHEAVGKSARKTLPLAAVLVRICGQRRG
jgi:hypothetical protein